MKYEKIKFDGYKSDDEDEEYNPDNIDNIKIPNHQKLVTFKKFKQKNVYISSYYYNTKGFILNFNYSFNTDKDINIYKSYCIEVKDFRDFIINSFNQKININITKCNNNFIKNIRYISIPISQGHWSKEDFSSKEDRRNVGAHTTNQNIPNEIEKTLYEKFKKGFIVFPSKSVVIKIEKRRNQKEYKINDIYLKGEYGYEPKKFTIWDIPLNKDKIFCRFVPS